MCTKIHSFRPLYAVILFTFILGVYPIHESLGQVSGGPDVNSSQLANTQTECAIIKNPLNNLELFAACNNSGPGLFATRSIDGGLTWIYPDPIDRTIADGDVGQGAAACCDPTLAWDNFGNLYVTYLAALVGGSSPSVETLLSTDGGQTFTTLASFAGSQDQPTIVAANTSAPGAPVAVWIVWNQSGQMRARGAAVTGLGAVGVFGALQTIPGTSGCSFGDVAISPTGAVVQCCQTPTGGEGPGTILVNTDTDGLGPGNFGAAVTATTTNVGGFDFIPAQNSRSVDSEAGLAYDRFDTGPGSPSPHLGRLYMVYTEETANENNDTDIMVRFSDDDGVTWSAAIRVNDDPAAPIRSQFLPKIASNPLSGNIAVCWHDSRNSATNTGMQVFCSIATPTGATPTFMANAQIGDGMSTSNGAGVEFGDYSGLTYFQGLVHPIWADISNSTSNNPNGTGAFDAYSDRVTGGAAANEGDPHITTADGVHYDFQSAGEFVSLRGDGLEIQTRQTAIATSFNPGTNPYTGLATCVSLNTAVAAQVGDHRVSYQPNISGVPDPSGLQLRIDGTLTTLGSNGLDLGFGGHIANASIGGGIEIDFPNGTTLIVTPGWWSSQSKWYLNVNAYHTLASEGTMGMIANGSWLPYLPDGSSLGPKPASIHDRYIDLNEKFADAWRVTKQTSLFDYAPGTSTATFTVDSWPKEDPPCVIPQETPVKPMDLKVAQELCQEVVGKNRNADCIFDVMVTGEPGFAKTYLITQRLEAGTTTTTVSTNNELTQYKELLMLTATVARKFSKGKELPAGTVQFTVDGRKVGKKLKLKANGTAILKTKNLQIGEHQVLASYTPNKGSMFLPSRSASLIHVIRQ